MESMIKLFQQLGYELADDIQIILHSIELMTYSNDCYNNDNNHNHKHRKRQSIEAHAQMSCVLHSSGIH